jgi:hypothetical protein
MHGDDRKDQGSTARYTIWALWGIGALAAAVGVIYLAYLVAQLFFDW